MKKLFIILALVSLFASCSKESDEIAAPVSSDSGIENAVGTRTMPFTATLNATADITSPPTSCSGDIPGFAAPDFLLSGTGTYLGQINAQVSNLHHVSCDLSFATMLLTTSVTVDLVASDGSVLSITGDDVVNVANFLTQTGTTGAITGNWTITGGTGRFAGAGGSLTINGTVDFVSNSFSCVCTGTITY